MSNVKLIAVFLTGVIFTVCVYWMLSSEKDYNAMAKQTAKDAVQIVLEQTVNGEVQKFIIKQVDNELVSNGVSIPTLVNSCNYLFDTIKQKSQQQPVK